MKKSVTIKRKRASDDLSFKKLKESGLKHIQDISGERWTDHNTHDPGITILEQLCYALTDLHYRTDRSVEELLCDSKGNIDLGNLALLPPEQAFSSRPTTIIDYRKALLNQTPEADNIWIEKQEEEFRCLRGLYSITVALRTPRETSTARKNYIRQNILRQFRANRNLCEDIDTEVTFLDSRECELHANIETGGRKSPSSILADIYHVCDAFIFPKIEARSYVSEADAGTPLYDLFDGPYTSAGYIRNTEFGRNKEHLHIPDLVSKIQSIDGVRRVLDVYLTIKDDRSPGGSGQIRDSIPRRLDNKLLRLAFPSSADEIRINMQRGLRSVNVSYADMRAEYEKYLHPACQQDKWESHQPDAKNQWITGKPKASEALIRNHQAGQHHYYSIQNDFPVQYMLHHSDIARDNTLQEPAHLRQLRAYLLLFEQVLANHVANTEHLKSFFSPHQENSISYATRAFDEHDIPGVLQYYKKSPAEWLATLQNSYDNYADHKGRLLDYLLALYGERFSQDALVQFDHYLEPGKIPGIVLQNKITMLNAIEDLSSNRAAAAQYEGTGTNAMSGLEKKARLVLGFDLEYKDSPMRDALWRIAEKQTSKLSRQFIDSTQLETVPQQAPDKLNSSHTYRHRKEFIRSMLNENISYEILRAGVFLRNYRLGPPRKNGYCKLYLVGTAHDSEDPSSVTCWPLALYKSREHAILAANILRNVLADINKSSEGMHVIEHILLRPRGAVPKTLGDFYNFKVSIMLPSWTSRCHDSSFQELVRETIELICPSHIQAEIYFCDIPKMRQFESLQSRWRKCKNSEKATPQQLDKCAAQLREFLWLEELENLLVTWHACYPHMSKLENSARELRRYLWPPDMDNLLHRKQKNYPQKDVSIKRSNLLRLILWFEEPQPALQRYMDAHHLDLTTLKAWTKKLQDFLRFIDFKDLLILWRKLYPNMEEFIKNAKTLRSILWLEDVLTEWRRFKIIETLDPVALRDSNKTFLDFLWFEELLAEWRRQVVSNTFDMAELKNIITNFQDLIRELKITL